MPISWSSLRYARRWEIRADQPRPVRAGDADAPGDCSRVQMKLKCDYLALTYLLKNAANVTQRYSLQERLLMVYFRVVFASLITRHWFRLRQEPAIMRLTVILQYFANLVGQRVSTLRFAEVTETN